MQQLLATVMGLVATGTGFLIARWIRRDRVSEIIDRRLKLVLLHSRMTSAGVDAAALHQLENDLTASKNGHEES